MTSRTLTFARAAAGSCVSKSRDLCQIDCLVFREFGPDYIFQGLRERFSETNPIIIFDTYLLIKNIRLSEVLHTYSTHLTNLPTN